MSDSDQRTLERDKPHLKIQAKYEHVGNLCDQLYELNAAFEQFGIALHVDYDELQAIKTNPDRPTVTKHMTEVLELWRKGKGKKTWNEVYQAVKKLRNYALAEKIESKGLENEVPMGNSYLVDMLELLEDVIPEWYEFDLNLGLPFGKMKLINARNLTAKRCMMKVIQAWIDQYGTEATFDKIIEACKKIGNLALAEKLEEDGMDGQETT